MKPVLIVEDEAIMRESLRDWLTDSGYQVETAEEGEEALKTLAEQDFGVAVLDLRLPGKDGLEVLRKAKERSPQLKGIIITAYPSIGTAVEAMKEGAVDYLPKPFDLNQLEKLIRDILGPVQVEIRPKSVIEEVTGDDFHRETAKWMNLSRVYDREHDLYKEIVTDPITGEVVHECIEPLSEHTGHGSAKHKKKNKD